MKKNCGLLFFFLTALTVYTEEIPKYPENNPLHFGNPSMAVTEADEATNYLMEKDGYSLSYNNYLLGPNWVAWHLEEEDFGDSGRSNKFTKDLNLPEEWYKVSSKDYQFNTYGFDRGHMCPSADRTSSPEINAETFLMTNMLPQSPNCNRIVWKNLEDYERELVKQGKELYIFAGGYGKGGVGQRGFFEEIELENSRKITVPEFCWKIILVLDKGDNDMQRITEETQVICVLIPNNQECSTAGGWELYECNTDYIEELTNFDFFSELPDELENVLEGK